MNDQIETTTTDTVEAPKPKKAATKKPTEAAKPSANGNGQHDGLRPLQIKVLKILKNRNSATRAQLYDKLEFKAHSGLNDVLGKNDPKKRAKADKAKYPSLLTLGLVELIDVDGSKEYIITTKGRKAV